MVDVGHGRRGGVDVHVGLDRSRMTLYSWGWNKFGQLGLGHNEDVNHPIRMATIPAADRYTLVPTVPLGAGDGDGRR